MTVCEASAQSVSSSGNILFELSTVASPANTCGCSVAKLANQAHAGAAPDHPSCTRVIFGMPPAQSLARPWMPMIYRRVKAQSFQTE